MGKRPFDEGNGTLQAQFPEVFECSLYIPSTIPALFRLLAKDNSQVKEVLQADASARATLIQNLPITSLWRVWIPMCAWLLGAEVPMECETWPADWDKIAPHERRDMVLM